MLFLRIMNQVILALVAIIGVCATDTQNTTWNDVSNYDVLPNDYVLPVIQDECSLTQLTLYVSYVSTTNLAMYVYPPFQQTNCGIMNMYYTAFGPPTIPDASNMTAWYVSDIMDGLTCFGIQNVDAVNSDNVQINASMTCNDVGTSKMAVGWYRSRPNPNSHPFYSSSTGTASSTGSGSTLKNSAGKNNFDWVVAITIMVIFFCTQIYICCK